MKTQEIYYAAGESIIVEIPRRKRGNLNLTEALAVGKFQIFNVVVIEGYEELVKHALKNANDKKSNKGNWYLHFNGYCLDIIIRKMDKYEKKIQLNSYYGYRKAYQ